MRRAGFAADGGAEYVAVRDGVLRVGGGGRGGDDGHFGGRPRAHDFDGDSRGGEAARSGAARAHVSTAGESGRRAGAGRADGGGGGSGAAGRAAAGRRRVRNHEGRRHDGARAGVDRVLPAARHEDDLGGRSDPLPVADGALYPSRIGTLPAHGARRFPGGLLRERDRAGAASGAGVWRRERTGVRAGENAFALRGRRRLRFHRVRVRAGVAGFDEADRRGGRGGSGLSAPDGAGVSRARAGGRGAVSAAAARDWHRGADPVRFGAAPHTAVDEPSPEGGGPGGLWGRDRRTDAGVSVERAGRDGIPLRAVIEAERAGRDGVPSRGLRWYSREREQRSPARGVI